MPANFQRLLPIMLVAIVVIFVLPSILKKHASGPSSKTKSVQTLDAMRLIANGEKAYQGAHGRFTSHLADLISPGSGLGADLAIGLGVQLDVSTDGQRYLAQVESSVLSLVRVQTGGKVTSNTCLVVKSGSGVHCPAAAA